MQNSRIKSRLNRVCGGSGDTGGRTVSTGEAARGDMWPQLRYAALVAARAQRLLQGELRLMVLAFEKFFGIGRHCGLVHHKHIHLASHDKQTPQLIKA